MNSKVLFFLLFNSFYIGERSSFSRDVVLKTPRKAAAGEPVTLTLMVHARDSADSNYAVVYLTVIPQVTVIPY